MPMSEFEAERQSMIADRDALRAALWAIYQSTREDAKGEQWTIRRFLDEHHVFNDDIAGSRRLVEAACMFALAGWVPPSDGEAQPASHTPPEDRSR